MRYGTYSIGGRKFGTKAISISCRVVSERTTFGTMKMAIELSREKPTPPRSHRYTKIDRAFASSSTITRSTPPARGFGSRSNGLTDPKTGEARSRAGMQSYRIEAGKLAETWLSLMPLGSAWSDTVAQERWTVSAHDSQGRRPWPGLCRRGYLVRRVGNGSVEPFPIE